MAEGSIRARERQGAWDALTHWCAERSSGDWATLRDAASYVGLDGAEIARALGALGHLELSWPSRRWAAAAPCLVQLEAPAGRLLLTGAVTPDLPQSIDAALADEGVDASLVGPFTQGGRGPSTFHVECDHPEWPAVERATGLPVLPAVARRLAALLPPADPVVIGIPHIPDDRFPAAPLDSESLRPSWGAPVEPGRPAVQRLPTRSLMWWVRDAKGRARRLPSGEWAPFMVERGAAGPLIRYEAPSGILAVDAAAPLPPLHARAACLCSGRLPGRAYLAVGQSEDRYRAVPQCVADAIVRSLGRPQGMAA